MGTDPFGYGADKFQYTIPPEITPGDYTLAWTWFNKIGEREMYMNCAPITVTGSSHYAKRDLDNAALSSDDNTFAKRDMSSLPDMFVANIGNGCSTAPSGTDLAIPVANRGKYIQRFDTGPLTPPVGNCGGSSSDGTGAGTAVPVPPAAQPSAHAPSPSPEAQPSTPALQPPPHPQPQPQPQLQPSAPSAQPQGSPSSAALTHIPSLTTGTCHTPGKSVCSPDSLSIGTCDEHNQVIFQPVPLGTKCDKALGVEVHARRSHMLRRKSEGTSDTKTFRKKQVDGDVGERGWGVVNCERADTPGCDSVLQHEKHTRVEMEEMSVGELRALSSGGRGLRGRSRCAGHGTLLRSEKGLAGDGDVEE